MQNRRCWRARAGRLASLVALLGLFGCEVSSSGAPTAAKVPDAGGAGTGAGGMTATFDGGASDAGAGPDTPSAASAPTIFVVAMENESAAKIYGSASAPFINRTLIPQAAHATNFADVLPALPSEPHYVWMEAGSNAFADHVFITDDSPSSSNVTSSGEHLASQLTAAGQSWIAYQEGMTPGTCPIASVGNFRPRHDPFLFFTDVVGSPPSPSAPVCIAHHRPLTALAGDLASGNVGRYNFITPDLCHDMHGSTACPPGDLIRAGDDWLSVHLPPLIDYVNAHGGVVFLVWDEGSSLPLFAPFFVAGPGVKAGYASPAAMNHSSMLKTVELLLGVGVLPTVAAAPDLQDLFEYPLPASPAPAPM